MANVDLMSFTVYANYYNKQGILTHKVLLDLWYDPDPDSENTPVCTSSNPNLPSSLADCAPWVELDCGVGVYDNGVLYSYQNFQEVILGIMGPEGLHIYPESYINGENTGGDDDPTAPGTIHEGQIFCNYYNQYGQRIHSEWLQCYSEPENAYSYSTAPTFPEGVLETYGLGSWAPNEEYGIEISSDGSLIGYGTFGNAIGQSIDITPYSYYVYLRYNKNNENISIQPEEEKYIVAIDGSYENYVTISDLYYNTDNGVYGFVGWVTEDGRQFNPGQTYLLSADLILYAQWNLNDAVNYTINYFKNNSEIMQTEEYTSFELVPSYIISVNVPSNEAYTFVKWNWIEGNKFVLPQGALSLNPNIPVVNLYPVWKELPEPLTRPYAFKKVDGIWKPVKIFTKINNKWR